MSIIPNISIRVKISMVMFVLVAGVSLFIYLYFPPRLQEEATNAIVEKGKSISSMTAYALAPAIAFDDPKAVEEVFEAAKQNRDVLYLVVCNDSGRVISGFNLEKAGAVAYRQQLDITSLRGMVYRTSSSIMIGKGSIGTLYLGLSLEGMQQRVAESEKTVVVVSLFVFVFGLMLAFVVSAVLTNPLRRVLDAVEQISGGNVEKRAEVTSRDEVGAMARSFNTMVDTLVATQHQLADMNRSLEERVGRRTSELQLQIDEHERTKNTLQRREIIIDAVSSITELFLHAERWEDVISVVLEILGNAMQVSRVYVFTNESTDSSAVLATQVHEWCAEGITPEIGNAAMTQCSLRNVGLERWERLLLEGKMIGGIVAMLPAQERAIFAAHGVKSLVGVPIFVGRKLWGFLGFDECSFEREWLPAETEALTTAARNLGAAIERQNTIVALSASESRYRKFFDDDLTADFNASTDGTITDCNAAFAQIFGFRSVHDAMKMNLSVVFPTAAHMQELWKTLTDVKILTYYEMSLRHSIDGHTVHVVANLIGLFDDWGTLVQVRGYMFDDTRRKELEQQLMHAQKMESIGTLAGGIAHDFNNILAIIVGHVSLMLKSDPSKEMMVKSLQTIEKSTARGVNLVRQLLAFARKTATRMEPVDINEIVGETVKLLGQTFPKSVTIIREHQSRLPRLYADATQLNQVLLNLCVNARDAMSHLGTLTIGTRMADPELLRRRFPKIRENPYIELYVADTGTGMSKEVRDKIFEPFFTTKELGKGTGLGLAVVFGVVENHHGTIDVESEPGSGTTFHIYFPVSNIQVPDEKQAADEENEDLQGTGTILFAEDESEIRELIASEMTSRGYTIHAVSNGDEALAYFENHVAEIDLVLSDMGMPKLDGERLFYRLKKINPGVKMFIASGFLGPEVISRLEIAGITALIDKPYETTLLLRKIKSFLR
ncbi:MAG: response regulator [Ignavibacteriales bacterium]|nr:response regulator [Ignavibacteriales bacterium]